MAASRIRLLQQIQTPFFHPLVSRRLATRVTSYPCLRTVRQFAPLSTSATRNDFTAKHVQEPVPRPAKNFFVHPLSYVASTAVVEPGAVVLEGARVGEHVTVCAGCVVGRDVTVGAHSTLGCNVVLQNCTVGERCLLHSGVSVGQDGFGFFVDDTGAMQKKPQLAQCREVIDPRQTPVQTLSVHIGNGVEIGANSCVDRGSWRDTLIGDETKIDNLVQIGHNVVIGRCCILCGQVGIGGSATLGDFVVLAGQVGVADHVTITSKVRVAAKSGVVNDLKEAGDYAGFPAVKAGEWRKSVVLLRQQARGKR